MSSTSRKLLVPLALALVAGSAGLAWAQQAPKPENLVKWRQSAYQVIAWNSGRIKASVEGTYNKEEVVRSATVIAALANGGLGSLFAPGTEAAKGCKETAVKPALFTDGPKVAELGANFAREANALLEVAQAGDPAALKEQFGKLNRTCKACHDDYRQAP